MKIEIIFYNLDSNHQNLYLIMKEYMNTEIFKKSQEIVETLTTITDLFPEENEMLNSLKGQLLSDAMLIQAKLAGAHRMKLN